MTLARGLCIQTTYVTLPRAMQIPMFISGVRKVENALINSGAMDNFLTPKLAQRLGLKIQKLQIPKPILTVDGSEHVQGNITEFINLRIQLGNQVRQQMFYVATLGQDRAILGFPFLQKFNLQIDWTKGTTKGAQNIQIEPESKESTLIHIIQLQDKAREVCGEPADGESLFCTIRKVSFAQQWAAEADDKSKCMTAEQVPEEYQRHWQVFDEECAKQFPPSRQENMEIKLIPGAPAELDCKIYPLNQQELETLCKYLAE